jgi:hypothetical protein
VGALQARPNHEGPGPSPNLVTSRSQVCTPSAFPYSKPATGKEKGRALVLRCHRTCSVLLWTGDDHAPGARRVAKGCNFLPWRSNHGSAQRLIKLFPDNSDCSVGAPRVPPFSLSVTGFLQIIAGARDNSGCEWVGDDLTERGRNVNGLFRNCHDNSILEVGHPLEGRANYGAFPYPLGGFIHNLQSLVFIGYFGAPRSTSVHSCWLSRTTNPRSARANQAELGKSHAGALPL